MGTKENADFRNYLLEDHEPIPPNYYTDFVFKSDFWSRFLIKLNKSVLYLFNNYSNATLQNKDTTIRRALYHNVMSESRHKERDPSTTTSQQVDDDSSSNNRVVLTLPARNNCAYWFLIILQLLVFAHYLCAIITLSSPHNKRLAITSSKTLETIQTLVHIEDKPVRMQSKWYKDDSLLSSSLATDTQDRCIERLELYLFERYDRFYIWNLTESMDSSSVLYSIVNDYLVPEQNHSLQMFVDEVRLFCHTIGSFFITCGVLGSFLAELVPYDIAPLVFVFDPLYSAHHIKSRIRYYHNLIRQSYANYWSIYNIEQEHSSAYDYLFVSGGGGAQGNLSRAIRDVRPIARTTQTFRDDLLALSNSPTTTTSFLLSPPPKELRRIKKTAATRDELEDEFRHDFESYIPSARNNVWRKTLMIMLPLQQSTMWTFMSSALILMYLLFPAENYGALDRNHELKEFLSTGREPAGFNRTIATYCWPSPDAGADFNQTKAQLGRLVRRSIIDHLANTLLSLSPNMSRLRHLAGASADLELDFDGGGGGGDEYENDELDVLTGDQTFMHHQRLVVDSIEPTRSLDLINWCVPFLGAALTGLLLSLYFAIFFCVIHDLCFWLFEIRMKLDICKILLKLYSDRVTAALEHSEQQQQQQQLSSSINAPAAAHYSNSSQFQYDDKASVHFGDCKLRRASVGARQTSSDKLEINHCNVGTWHVIKYIFSDRTTRLRMCKVYAVNILARDSQMSDLGSPLSSSGDGARRHYSDSFLLSAYLDFRLFIEQIDMCRNSINFMLSYTVFHALNLIGSSQYTEFLRSKIGFMLSGYALANMTLFGSSFFQSQCMKLISPIYSILALSLNGDKTIRHLSSLWHRALVDLSGTRSKFSFRVYSVNISYATALEFNLGVTSLYILTLDKMRYRMS